jgi:hypothetical protein
MANNEITASLMFLPVDQKLLELRETIVDSRGKGGEYKPNIKAYEELTAMLNELMAAVTKPKITRLGCIYIGESDCLPGSIADDDYCDTVVLFVDGNTDGTDLEEAADNGDIISIELARVGNKISVQVCGAGETMGHDFEM